MHGFTLESCIIVHFIRVNFPCVNLPSRLGALSVSNVAGRVVRAPWGFGLGSRTGGSRCAVAGALPAVRGSRTANNFPELVAAGAGGLDAERIYCWRWFDRDNSLDAVRDSVTVKALSTERIVIWDSTCT
jgi:hypothetical protein